MVLGLSNNGIGRGVSSLFQLFIDIKGLRTLDLRRNCIRDHDANNLIFLFPSVVKVF